METGSLSSSKQLIMTELSEEDQDAYTTLCLFKV